MVVQIHQVELILMDENYFIFVSVRVSMWFPPQTAVFGLSTVMTH